MDTKTLIFKIKRKLVKLTNKLRIVISPLKQYELISYSQCGEDLIIDCILKQLKINNPSYLDLGANHPMHLSNTFLFYKMGFCGVCVEPDPFLFQKLKKKRTRDKCLMIGASSNEKNSKANFFIMSSRTLNTFLDHEAKKFTKEGHKIESMINVPIMSVNRIISENFKTKPNFVSLDIEGLDFDVLKHFNFEKYRPEIFCIETLTYTKKAGEKKLNDIIAYMGEKKYFVYADTYINTIFVDEKTWIKRYDKN